MEDSKNPKINILPQNFIDLRQSQKWSQYLTDLGWNPVIVNGDLYVNVMKTAVGGLIKIQRPRALTQKDFDEFEKICEAENVLYAKMEFLREGDKLLAQKNGYITTLSPLAPPSTMYINLQKSQDELWGAINKSGRYSIRRAERFEAYTQFYKNPSDEILHTFYDLARETSVKQKFAFVGFSDLEKKRNIFGEDCVVALGYTKEGLLTGGKFFLVSGKNVWYLHAGTNELGRANDAGHKLMWESFLYFKNMGLELMDLDGVDDPRFKQFTGRWGGFAYFKEKFGGELVRFPYPQIKIYHPIFKLFAKFIGPIL